jgi:hypothetical protein
MKTFLGSWMNSFIYVVFMPIYFCRSGLIRSMMAQVQHGTHGRLLSTAPLLGASRIFVSIFWNYFSTHINCAHAVRSIQFHESILLIWNWLVDYGQQAFCRVLPCAVRPHAAWQYIFLTTPEQIQTARRRRHLDTEHLSVLYVLLYTVDR